MIITKNENVCPFDVDNTLVLPFNLDKKDSEVVFVRDPLTPGRKILMHAHRPMIRLLKEEFSKGSHVIVWSRGGWQWAEAVVEALNLQNYVHEIKTKPMVYFDDLDVGQWLLNRVYLDPDTKYK